MVSKAFCRSMRIIPVNRPESKPVSILFVTVEWLSLLSGSCETQSGICRERYFPLNNLFGHVLLFL